MKKFYKRYRWLTICGILSIIVIILYFATYTWPELFPGAGRLFEILFQISIGYIINFIFFVVNIYLPQLTLENKAAQVCELPIVSLLEEIRDIENVFSSFIKLNYGRITYPTGIVYYKYPDTEGRAFIDITYYLRHKHSDMQRCFSSVVSNRYFNSLDTKVIELINDLQYSDFVMYLRHFTYCDGNMNNSVFGHNKYTKTLEESYQEFLRIARKLQVETDANLSSLKQFSILEGDEREKYIRFIEEERAKHAADGQKCEKYYVGNSQIY